MQEVSLSPCQETAVHEFLEFMDSDDSVFVLTGGPGRGKTFLTKFLVEQVKMKFPKLSVYCTATTNKAATVLEEHMEVETMTIHKLLKLRVKNDYRTGRQYISTTPQTEVIHDAFIVVDEISMADTVLLNHIKSLTRRCKLLFVGDEDQLAPVGEGYSPAFHQGYKVFELETVMRQKAGSPIIDLANALRDTVRTGKFTPLMQFANGEEVQFVSGEEFQEIVDDEFSVNFHRLNHGKLICWTNATVNAYNDYVRKLHTSSEDFEVDELVVTNIPVMNSDGQTVFNTDETAIVTDSRKGTLYDIEGVWYTLDDTIEVFQSNDRAEEQRLIKRLAAEAKAEPRKWVEYFKVKESFGDLRAVHACTSHKSQGSTYGTSYIDLNDIGACFEWETVARMLYVAITRAKNRVIFYGTLPARYQNGVFKKCDISGSKTELPTLPPF